MKSVKEFEKLVASYYGAKYAVATDCCTHAIELCLRLYKPERTINCPRHTYLSVPMTFEKLNLAWEFFDVHWSNYYYIGNTNIIDAAVYWKREGYVHGSLMCLSFQYRKHLNLGRGGMILLDNKEQYETLLKMRYDGRTDDKPWMEQDVDTIGYHYYMTPETAELGLQKFSEAVNTKPKLWSYKDYPDLRTMKVFNVQQK
jgi:dTDP-4-amino-4,6-dideoxygalactose transaminase